MFYRCWYQRLACSSRVQVLATALVLCAATACSKSDSPTAPSPSGALELTVSPRAVSYAGGAGVGGPICPVPYLSRWGPFTWTIREINGRPVTVTSFKYVVTTVDGREESNEEIIRGTAANFTGTAAPTLQVPANTSYTSRSVYDCQLDINGRPAFPGGTATFIVSGTDDAGASVSSTTTLTLLPPQ